MISVSKVLVAAVAVSAAACGGGDSEGETFTTTGTVQIGSMSGGVLAADGATEGDRCQGAALLSDYRGDAEVVVEDADGKKVAVGKLEDGVIPQGADAGSSLGLDLCDFAFEVRDVPSSDDLMTLVVGDEETTFKEADASGIVVTVTDD